MLSLESLIEVLPVINVLVSLICALIIKPLNADIKDTNKKLEEETAYIKDSIEASNQDRRNLDTRLAKTEESLKNLKERVDKVEEIWIK